MSKVLFWMSRDKVDYDSINSLHNGNPDVVCVWKKEPTADEQGNFDDGSDDDNPNMIYFDKGCGDIRALERLLGIRFSKGCKIKAAMEITEAESTKELVDRALRSKSMKVKNSALRTLVHVVADVEDDDDDD